MQNDLTFITNEANNNLRDRFVTLIKDTKFFDVLVGYFYTSGFYSIYPSLEKTEKIRILVGISTDRATFELAKKAISHRDVKNEYATALKSELDSSDNSLNVENGVKKFLEWLVSGKLEIKAYPHEKIHSKIYIMTFNDGDRDLGRVITGSSNFTESGLVGNLEFNVELKNASDHKFAQDKFNELWAQGIDLSEKYIDTIKKDTWLREDITPYELYLKFLYEYFKDEINDDTEVNSNYRPSSFKELKYQEHAVKNAKKIINEYGGVFLSDVVGLGKTYMATMLCQELGGKTLILAPPHLIDEANQGSWENSFRNFGFRSIDYKCRSVGVLDQIIARDEHNEFDTILIDESHRFRTEDTQTYSELAQICSGKKVILVTATPYNNSPKDLLSQIKLFQKPRQSTIPNLRDLEGFFRILDKKFQGLDRKRDKEEFLKITKENSKIIREKVLKYLMVRRTRKEIIKYYGEDLKKQGMSFPEIAEPVPIFYEFNNEENKIFFETIQMLSNEFKYSRYTPMLYFNEVSKAEMLSQKNMMKFMKMLLIKRLESSFHAFNQSIRRFINSYERFLNEYNNGVVYVSKKHTQKIFDYLDNDDFESVEKLVEDGRAEKHYSTDFTPNLKLDLINDLQVLKSIEKLWAGIKRDPKVLAFKNKLLNKNEIQNKKLIIFTESLETANYLAEELQSLFPKKIICFTGASNNLKRETVMANFDANYKQHQDEYSVLITTDVLSEGANLHRSNIVINYDIPWNPTKVMQRVGRVNRVDTKFDTIHSFTFFPTDQSNDQIKLRECAEAKIHAFISLLGSDSKLLTEDEEVEAHKLFSRLLSKEAIEGDEEIESDLGYLVEIRKIRDEQPELFEKIKKLPKKSRTARDSKPNCGAGLITYFRKGKLQKFFYVEDSGNESEELNFIKAAELLKSDETEQRKDLDIKFYKLLNKNIEKLDEITSLEEDEFVHQRGSRDYSTKILKFLKSKQIKNFENYTVEDIEYLNTVTTELEGGAIPKKISQKIFSKIESSKEILSSPQILLKILKDNLSDDFVNHKKNNTTALSENNRSTKNEIILSEYFKAGNK